MELAGFVEVAGQLVVRVVCLQAVAVERPDAESLVLRLAAEHQSVVRQVAAEPQPPLLRLHLQPLDEVVA